MKKNLILLALLSLPILSCDTNDDNNPATVCDAKFYSFQSASEITSPSDIFNVGYLSKFSASAPSIFNNSIPNTNFTDNGTLFFPTSALKNDNSQLVCLANKTSGKRLFKADFSGATVSQNSTISADLSAPVFVNNDLRFLKITNKTTQMSPPYNDVVSLDVELVDENGTSFSGVPQTIALPSTVENGFRDANIEAAYLNTTVYFLANCQLITFNTLTNVFAVHTLDSYNFNNDRKFFQGIEISNTNTLLLLKQTVLPANKIEIVELAGVASNVFTPTTLYNLEQSDFPGSAPQLASIINTSDRRSTTYDPCDNKYYFTYMSNYNPYSTDVYEINLNAFNITKYPFNNNFLFGLEVQK